MKRFLLAAVLALTIHGLFLGLGPKLLSKAPPAKPKALTITFATRHEPEAGPGPELKYPVPSPDEVARVIDKRVKRPVVKTVPQKEIPKPLKKLVLPNEPEARPGPELEDPVPSPDEVARVLDKRVKRPVVKTVPQKEIPKPPKKFVSLKKSVPKSLPKADVRPKKKIVKPPLKRLKPPSKALKPKKKERIIPPPPVKARSHSEKKPVPEVMSKPVATPGPVPVSRNEEKTGDLRDPLLGIPGPTGHMAPEAGEKVAAVPRAKRMIRARPAYRRNPRPAYPKMAKRRGYEGTVLLEVLVNSAGKVDDLRLLKSSGYRVLDRSAMKSVKNWLFEPGSVGEQKVDMWVRIPVRFELR
ncbi:MAG: TonB family protein [Deltaproteobacteria bacterium]|nr:TonB family protein [Deltaproteobacteria bacterium]